jgi:Lrp/AsnC family leucine-responsive transcriptional regulator
MDRPLDDVDWRLLEELQQDARLSFTELGRRVGLTRPAVAERVDRLERAGVIAGYRAVLDLGKVGRPVTAFVRVRTDAHRLPALRDLVLGMPEALECHRVTGEDCYVVKVAVAGIAALEDVVDRLMRFGGPQSTVVLSSPLTHRVLRRPA